MQFIIIFKFPTVKQEQKRFHCRLNAPRERRLNEFELSPEQREVLAFHNRQRVLDLIRSRAKRMSGPPPHSPSKGQQNDPQPNGDSSPMPTSPQQPTEEQRVPKPLSIQCMKGKLPEKIQTPSSVREAFESQRESSQEFPTNIKDEISEQVETESNSKSKPKEKSNAIGVTIFVKEKKEEKEEPPLPLKRHWSRPLPTVCYSSKNISKPPNNKRTTTKRRFKVEWGRYAWKWEGTADVRADKCRIGPKNDAAYDRAMNFIQQRKTKLHRQLERIDQARIRRKSIQTNTEAEYVHKMGIASSRRYDFLENRKLNASRYTDRVLKTRQNRWEKSAKILRCMEERCNAADFRRLAVLQHRRQTSADMACGNKPKLVEDHDRHLAIQARALQFNLEQSLEAAHIRRQRRLLALRIRAHRMT